MKFTIKFYPVWFAKSFKKRECDECGRRSWVRAAIIKREEPEYGMWSEEMAASFCARHSTSQVIEKHMERLKRIYET